jgi:lectin, mannose-binding 2
MALWITKQRGQTGTVFGFTDNFEGLGIFIDTYKNGRAGTTFPYVMAMLGDGQTPYDNDNDGKANDVGGCSVFTPIKRRCLLQARGIRKASVPTKGRLTYHKDNFLSLELQYRKDEEFHECFNIPNVTLPTVTYLGFSAHTGEVSGTPSSSCL